MKLDPELSEAELTEARRNATKNIGRWLFDVPWDRLSDQQRSRAHALAETVFISGSPVALRDEGVLVAFGVVVGDRLIYQCTNYSARHLGIEVAFTDVWGPPTMGFRQKPSHERERT